MSNASVIVRIKDAYRYFASANDEMEQMVEIILRGMCEDVKNEDIYEACHVLAEPLFGEDYHEYVDEVMQILRVGILPQDMNALSTWFNNLGLVDPDVDISFSVIEPDAIAINLEVHDDTCNGRGNAVSEPIRAHATLGPRI